MNLPDSGQNLRKNYDLVDTKIIDIIFTYIKRIEEKNLRCEETEIFLNVHFVLIAIKKGRYWECCFQYYYWCCNYVTGFMVKTR